MGDRIGDQFKVPCGAGGSHQQRVTALGIRACLPQDFKPEAVDPEPASCLEVLTGRASRTGALAKSMPSLCTFESSPRTDLRAAFEIVYNSP